MRLLHPAIQDGVKKGNPAFAGGVLTCKCTDRPVKVRVAGGIAHNHACGCTKCWKPEGASFSVVAVAPTGTVTVVENGDKLAIVDDTALILRHACKVCGTHMYGPVERDHAFKGLAFVHPELFDTPDWPEPGFAAFVSSVIERVRAISLFADPMATHRRTSSSRSLRGSSPACNAISWAISGRTRRLPA